MAIYAYQCPKCLEQFEIMKPISRMDNIEFCPECEVDLERQVTSPAHVKFVGQGFYVNDYKKKSPPSEE